MFFKRKSQKIEIELDEIFADATNLPDFNTGRLEGRIEEPLSKWNLYGVSVIFFFIAATFLAQLFSLQVVKGEQYAKQSATNTLAKNVIFAERGVVKDRNGELLAWNIASEKNAVFSERTYSTRRGIGPLVGYVSYPRKDKTGFYYRTEYIGRGGVEEGLNQALVGENGEQLMEVNAHGKAVSQHVVHESVPGKEVTLSIDAALSEALYDQLATTTLTRGYHSGAGAIIDVHTGEIIAMASYPAFDPNVIVKGEDANLIESYSKDDKLPFLDKIISGLYTPGSIVKPFLAFAALRDHTIDPLKTIFSAGKMYVPNPYTPDHPSVFTDWKANGAMDMRHAIAMSSNIYFYQVGGGFEGQKGVGIDRMHDFFTYVGLASTTGIELPGEVSGNVPNPAWKKKVFNEDWRLGDTYFTSIGQYGFQVTPLEMLRAYAAIANGGTLLTPTVLKTDRPIGTTTKLIMPPEHRQIVIEGMRLAAQIGTAKALNKPYMEFAAKSGTAELGATKAYVNSWVTGFFPYKKPKYAFIFMMEHGPRANLFGSSPAFGQYIDWIHTNAPQYLTLEGATE